LTIKDFRNKYENFTEFTYSTVRLLLCIQKKWQ